jgi:predicted Ser/Thr protein kinase
MEFFKKGKRGKIFRDTWQGKEAIVKKARHYSVLNEIKWLKILNKHGIGPKFYDSGEDYFICEYLKGTAIQYYKGDLKEIFLNVLKQCRMMDKLKVNKLEMHNPTKHIIIDGDDIRLIDFERCKITETPKNVTQFVQFICKKTELDFEKVKPYLVEYKEKMDDKSFEKLLKFIADFL